MQINDNLYDVVIVGGGPAGLSAAIYMARAKYKTLVLEKAQLGGQITITSEIVNYPGVEKVSGTELTDGMCRQAESFGAEFAIAEVLDMELKDKIKVIHTTKGEYRALGVILATGANPRKLGFKGEQEFQGRGVAYCATCDGEFFTGLDVFVIGGGFAAVEEGLFLTKYAKKITIVVRRSEFSCAKTVSDKLKGQDKIEVIFNTGLLEVGGEQMLSYAKFRNNQTGEEWTRDAEKDGAFGVFVFAGYVPNTDWIGSDVERSDQGYLLTDENQKTSIEGVYAAGDVCVKELRQVVTAVSDGAVAATSLEKVLCQLHEELQIPDLEIKRPQNQEPGNNGSEDGKRAGVQEEKAGDRGFLSEEIKQQLQGVFSKFEHRVLLKAWLGEDPLSGEILGFLRELEGLTDKVSWKEADGSGEKDGGEVIRPAIELCYEDGRSSGILFHGVPGGHEFNSFIIALYNVAGPGQDIEPATAEKIRSISEKKNLKVLVSLSCTMCPETVMSAQKAASLSENVKAEMFDLAHFPELKEKYKVMSVPCMVVNDEHVFFGKKGINEISEIICQ